MAIDTSKLNVISREYRTIYTDLVKAIPLLTSQWTTNDESDPGVVLVKLMSMIGDMLSYNRDKAYLEAFPDTVTQRKNAYQLFKLVGYKMKWYRSATCECYFNNINLGEYASAGITIPRWTRIMSDDRTVCYTNPVESLYIRAGIDGSIDKRNQTTLVQGIPITPDVLVDSTYVGTDATYVINKNDKWHSVYKYNVSKETIEDSRIYFSKSNVEQNYISLVDDKGEEWQMVDNINVYNSTNNNKVFEFDVDEFDRPYIKLIDYWEDLGINKFKLFYILSSGIDGKINANILNSVGSSVFSLLNPTAPKLYISNADSTDGYNPETPEEARKESSLYINTFDTLVTLDDYTKFIKRSEYVANAISKDITNDFRKYNGFTYTSYEDLCNKIISSLQTYTDFDAENDIKWFNDNLSPDYELYSYDTSTGIVTRSSAPLTITGDRLIELINLAVANVNELTAYVNGSSYLTGDIVTNNSKTFICIKDITASATPPESDTEHWKEYFVFNDLFEIIHIYWDIVNNPVDTGKAQNLMMAETILRGYYDLSNRIALSDLEYLYEKTFEMSTEEIIDSTGGEINSRSVNVYVTLEDEFTNISEGYDTYEYYKSLIESNLDNAKMIPTEVYTTAMGIDYYVWDVYGTVYLKTPVSYGKSQDILLSIGNNLILQYAHNNIYYNTPVKTVELAEQIADTDPSIHFVDIDKITYQRIDRLTGTPIGEPFTDKTIISNDKFILNLPYGSGSSNSILNGKIFTIDFFDEYEDLNGETHKYLDYTDQEIQQGNILLKPGSICVILEGSSYIIKDNGYGSLVCNENIIKSSSIDYKITYDENHKPHMKLTFELYDEIEISASGTANVKYSENRLSMVTFNGINPNNFIIDNDSIEL